MARAGMATRIAEPLLHDPEDLDLLVRGEPHLRVDVELDVELRRPPSGPRRSGGAR